MSSTRTFDDVDSYEFKNNVKLSGGFSGSIDMTNVTSVFNYSHTPAGATDVMNNYYPLLVSPTGQLVRYYNWSRAPFLIYGVTTPIAANATTDFSFVGGVSGARGYSWISGWPVDTTPSVINMTSPSDAMYAKVTFQWESSTATPANTSYIRVSTSVSPTGPFNSQASVTVAPNSLSDCKTLFISTGGSIGIWSPVYMKVSYINNGAALANFNLSLFIELV